MSSAIDYSPLHIQPSSRDGRGVFATRAFEAGDLIEEAPVLIFPTSQLYSPQGTALLADYVFVWDDAHVALALGFGSLYNHSYDPNAFYEDVPPASKRFIALRDIPAGEEITVNYNGQTSDTGGVGFSVR